MRTLLMAVEAADHQISAIHTAFGAPGDHGYESREGKALYELYKFQIELRATMSVALIDQARTSDAPDAAKIVGEFEGIFGQLTATERRWLTRRIAGLEV